MNETRKVTLTVYLPHDIATQAKEVQKTDPEFLSRVVLYGLTRRSIYHQLREHLEGATDDLVPPTADVQPILGEDQREILEEATR